MKRWFLFLFFILLLATPAFSDEPCGKTFKFFYNEVTYIMKFSDKIEEFPCTSGTATFYWFNKESNFSFSVDSDGFIKLNGFGTFTIYKEKLYYLDTTEIVLDQL